jgi:hypothetical protein
MATAHGAGLMLVPVLLGTSTTKAFAQMPGHNHMNHFTAATSPMAALAATLVHTAGYLTVTGLIAWIVYRKVGLAVLRKTWFNTDLVWAVALVATGLLTFLM